MKKCIVVSDSFKGTLSSFEICQVARKSIPHFFSGCQVVTIPVADGGEGTVASFIQAMGAQPVVVSVRGPWWETVSATYAKSGGKAIIEMASAAGLPLAGARRDPARTTTYGVGEMMRDAAESGCHEILLGLGGSATNDGGCGAAAALGTQFYDEDGTAFIPLGESLGRISRVDVSATERLLARVSITVMCDVENPLYGPQGAAHIFAPQKGADAEAVARLDQGLRHLDGVFMEELGRSLAQLPGAGAAGGMGAGCVAFFGAELKSGIEAVLDMVEFDRHLEGADLVITGEGRIDAQSARGKVVSGIAKRTARRGIPLVAIVGAIDDSADAVYDLGVTAMFGIDREGVAFDQYAHRSEDNYRRTLEDVLRLIKAAETMGNSP